MKEGENAKEIWYACPKSNMPPTYRCSIGVNGKKGPTMEKIIRVVQEKSGHGITIKIVETDYEFGTHFVMLLNGKPGFHSTDLERVERYMNDILE